jgi:peptidase E
MKAGYACDDGVAGYFVNEELVEFVSSRPSAKAYRVEKSGDQILETVVAARYLG